MEVGKIWRTWKLNGLEVNAQLTRWFVSFAEFSCRDWQIEWRYLRLNKIQDGGWRPSWMCKMAITSQPVCWSTWCLVLGWGFRLRLDFYSRGLHTVVLLSRVTLASAGLSCYSSFFPRFICECNNERIILKSVHIWQSTVAVEMTVAPFKDHAVYSAICHDMRGNQTQTKSSSMNIVRRWVTANEQQ